MSVPFSPTPADIQSSKVAELSSRPHTRFAFRLFHELLRAGDAPNIFFSPSSIMLCLGLVRELASGETQQSMGKALEISDLDEAGIESEISTLMSAFNTPTNTEISVANALFLGRHAQIAAALQAKLSARYGAELTGIDFSSPEAVATINAWVNDKTKGKITKIVQQLSPLAALVALNAVYFKSGWLNPFRKVLTRDKAFRTASGATKQVPMMMQNREYKYYEDDQIQVAALPYRGNTSMYILLPAADADMAQFRQDLNSGLCESWMSKLRSAPGTIQLPRFRVDYSAELNSVLKALGMARAFDPKSAEFTHVQTDLLPIWIDRVMHRAVVEVNEEGTEAAAATVVKMLLGAAFPQKPPKHFQMIVDHPFVALIRDEATKAILFMGWIGDPQ